MVLGVAVLIGPRLATPAQAQHTPDPYNIVGEYNVGYENHMYATFPNGSGFTPNQGILQGQLRAGYSRANQFSSFIQELDGVGSGDSITGFGSPAGSGIQPYWRAHHQFDEAFQRVYIPNEAPDRTYYEDQKARTDKYLAYLRETDPKKRAKLYREYQNESLRAARDFSAGSTRAAYRNSVMPRASATAPARDTFPSNPSSSPLPAGRPASRSGLWTNPYYRRPSSSSTSPPAACTGRARPATPSTTSPLLSETPEQILRRAESMDRAYRGSGAASNPSSGTVTPSPR
jgi:hypothetical protein